MSAIGLPATISAVLQTDPSAHHLALLTLPLPTIDIKANEHLVRVYATSPCNNELNWWSYPNLNLSPTKRFVPCFDLAGTVIAGPPASSFQPGDRVFTRTAAGRTGNAREYTVALTSELAHMPRGMGFVEAASVPLSAFTAYQALFVHGGIDVGALHGDKGAAKRNAGIRVLITAAAGGVGLWMVQLAKAAGVKDIVAVCGPENVEFVRELGAMEVVDYRKCSLHDWACADTARKADLVIDCVGGKNTTQCWYAVKESGRLISIVQPSESVKPTEEGVSENIKASFFIMEPRGEQLEMVRQLLEDGRCRTVVDSVYGFEDFQAAFDRVATGHARGKVIIKIAKD